MMLVVEYMKKDSASGVQHEPFIRSVPGCDDNDHQFLSIYHFVHPEVDDLPSIRKSLTKAAYPEMAVVVEVDDSSPDYRQIRQAFRVWNRYLTYNLHLIKGSHGLDFAGCLELVKTEWSPHFSRAAKLGQSIQVRAGEVRNLAEHVRQPYRLDILEHLPYYKNGIQSRIRGIQQLNFLKYIAANASLSFDFNDRSMVEIGPGAGFLYRLAQARGLARLHVVDKNCGFCELAEADGAVATLELDITDPSFSDSFLGMLGGRVDYVFAKGILNVYAFSQRALYQKAVEIVTESLCRAGIWVTYNIDRENGHDEDTLAFASQVFHDLGWKKLDVQNEMRPLIGLNYLPEVDWGLWYYRKNP